MKTSDAIFDILKRYTDTVFLVPGGGAMHLVDSLGSSGIRFVPCLHEQGAGYAAIGYALTRMGGGTTKGKCLGVCLVTSGPGATNALTPLAAAWMDSVPVLFISGQALSSTLVGGSGLRTRGVQEVDIIPIVRPITKDAYRPVNGWAVPKALEAMIELCLDGRQGPCWLDVPLDVQAEEI